MDKTARTLLERVIKLASGVSCLHSRYELGKEGYEELRKIQREAMALLKEEEGRSVLFVDRSGKMAIGQPAPTDELWHGYRPLDVLACARVRHPLSNYEMHDGLIVKIINGERFATHWHEMQVECHLRDDNGLRRPDEPDYKRLG